MIFAAFPTGWRHCVFAPPRMGFVLLCVCMLRYTKEKKDLPRFLWRIRWPFPGQTKKVTLAA